MTDADWRAAGERIEALLGASAAGGAVARERAEELVRIVVDLYGAGLSRLLEVLHDRGALGDDALDALAGDALVSSLLLVHGLHPHSAETRATRAVAAVGDATLVEITTEGIARVRLTASGCGTTAVKAAVEEALADAVPELTGVEVVAATPSMIPLETLFTRVGAR